MSEENFKVVDDPIDSALYELKKVCRVEYLSYKYVAGKKIDEQQAEIQALKERVKELTKELHCVIYIHEVKRDYPELVNQLKKTLGEPPKEPTTKEGG